MHTIKVFIETYIARAGESVAEISESLSPQLFQYTMVKKTARTYRKTAIIKIAAATNLEPPAPLLAYKFTPKAKRQLTETAETIHQWLCYGWIVYEIRLARDGISPLETYYRMGPSLLAYYEQQAHAASEQLQQLQQKAQLVDLPATIAALFEQQPFPQQWSRAKQLKFLHFAIAFFSLAQQQRLFDYKEIGATYLDTIGGSKLFDREQHDFLAFLTELKIDVEAYGLVSLGKITPIYFTGTLQGQVAHYAYGAIHALTDHALLHDTFTTKQRQLWLVENRAILTRMVTETAFLQQTDSFVLCLDGQIRSAHRVLIQQLLPAIQHVFIWTDYDQAGGIIAKHAAAIIGDKPKTFIARQQLFHHLSAYTKWLATEPAREQEQQLGGVTEWNNWIQQSYLFFKQT